MTDGALKITESQRQQFDEDGFFLVEEALAPDEVDELIELVDVLYEKYRRERDLGPHKRFQMRNVVAAHPLFRRLIDHPAILPLVVDTIGFNIQLRTSHMDVRPPQELEDGEAALGTPDSFFPWHADAPDYGWALVDGVIPFMELKVGYYLTDLTAHNSGAICVVRGSHRQSPWMESDGERVADPERIVEVNVKPGTAMIWHTQLYHAGGLDLTSQPI